MIEDANTSSNINYIAFCVNSTDNIYAVDFSEIAKELNQIW